MDVIPDKKLREIMNLYQTRIIRTISQGDQKIAKAYLDDIKFSPKGKTKKFKRFGIKILIPDGKTHLEKITKTLQDKWSLEIDHFTKFERALVVIEQK
jgi:hypothetical protein